MRLRTQSIIALVLSLFFVLSVPLVLLHTAGYRINIRTRRLEHTGLMIVRSTPREATIILDGVRQEPTTPARLVGLLPRGYRVRLEKEGYRAWEKNVTVASNRTTFIDDVLLFPDRLPERVHDMDASAVHTGPDGTLLWAASVPGFTEIWLEERNAEPKIATRVPTSAADSAEVLWSRTGNSLVVTFGAAPGHAVYITRTGGLRSRSIDTPQTPLTSSAWTDPPQDELAYILNRRLYFLSNEAEPIPFGTEPADTVWYADGTYFVGQSSTSTLNITALAPNGSLLRTVASIPVHRAQFIPSHSGTLTLGDGRRLWVIDAQSGETILETDAQKATWSASTADLLLYWTDFELWSFQLSTRQRTLLTRFGSPIRDAAWYPGDSYAVVLVGEEVQAIERGDMNGRLTVPLFSLPGLRAFTVNGRTGTITAAAVPSSRPGLFQYPIVVP